MIPLSSHMIWAASWQNQQSDCAPSEVFAGRTCHFVGFVMKWLIFHFNILFCFIQVGLLLFDSRPHLQWNLQDYPTKAELLSALNYVPYHNGPTQTDQALKYVNDHMLTYASGDRSYARNVVILVTGGMSQNHANTVREANRLHAKSSDVIVVGMSSNGHHNTELVNIATDANHVIETSDISHIKNVIPRLLNLIC